jgi:hypothetical protein
MFPVIARFSFSTFEFILFSYIEIKVICDIGKISKERIAFNMITTSRIVLDNEGKPWEPEHRLSCLRNSNHTREYQSASSGVKHLSSELVHLWFTRCRLSKKYWSTVTFILVTWVLQNQYIPENAILLLTLFLPRGFVPLWIWRRHIPPILQV